MMKGPGERSRRLSPMGIAVAFLVIGLVLGLANVPVHYVASAEVGNAMLLVGVILVFVSFILAFLEKLRTG